MKSGKVLIIAFHAPPKHSSAAHRVRGLLKYLPQSGWSPMVLTKKREGLDHLYADSIEEAPHPGNVDEILRAKLPFVNDEYSQEESPFIDGSRKNTPNLSKKITRTIFNRTRSLITDFASYPDNKKYWKANALNHARSLFEDHEFDAIISTAPPPTDHLVAYQLAKEYDCPWIADYRDLWTEYHYNEHNIVRDIFEKRLEQKVIRQADHITAATPPFAEYLQERHQKPTTAIYNGFDNKGTLPTTNDFTITYTGGLSRGKRDPTPLFKAIKELERKGCIDSSECMVNFVGDHQPWLTNQIKSHGLEDTIHQTGRLPRRSVLEEQKKSQILLSIQWDHPMERMVCPGKIFEYLAAKRPILAYGGPTDGVVSSILDKTGAGKKVSTEDEIQQYIHNAYNDYEDTGEVTYSGVEEEIDKFKHEIMANKFANILSSLE